MKEPDPRIGTRARLTALAAGLADSYGYRCRDRLSHVAVGDHAGVSLWSLTRGYVLVWCASEREGRAFFLDRAEAVKESWTVETMVRQVDASVRGAVESGHTATP